MQYVQGPLAAVLSLSLLAASTPGAAQAASEPGSRRPYQPQLQGDMRILHALNRFTFGPRPGDLEAVRAMGLDRWFEQQLHPATIDNSALQTRLADFPAMQWSPQDLLFRLPSNAIIRQVIDGKTPIPATGALHAIYADQVERIAARRQQKEQKTQLAASSSSASPIASNESATMTSPANPTADVNSNQMAPMEEASAKPPSIDLSLTDSILALPPRPRVQRLIALEPEQAEAFFRSLRGPQRAALTADLSPDLKLTVEALQNPERAVAEGLMAQRLTRDVYSNAQLEEVMTDFWLNHFNVYLRKNEATPYYLVSYERDVIRPRALGKFEDLLEAVAHCPAMLIYLDNAQSIGPDSPAAERAKFAAARNPNKNKKAREGLNENYARELMELHTLGVNGGYTQADVIQAARILTGWTVDRPQRGGGFFFDERRHEPGTKKVLGHKFKEHGEKEGRDLLHMLATRPATAQFISRKLAVRFVSDDPPQALVDRMTKSYLSSGGDIAAVLRTMVRSPEFWNANLYRAKVKTPLEYVVSAARAASVDITNMQPLIVALRDMGMPLYGCIPPTGYKWDAADWVSTGALVARMNFALGMAANRLNGVSTHWSLQQDPSSSTATTTPPPTEEEARLESRLVAGGVGDSTRSAVLEQFQQQSAAPMPVAINPRRAPNATALEKQDQLLAGLLLGSPEFQRR
jgi:uncharacterized protein (DUF1800 family)